MNQERPATVSRRNMVIAGVAGTAVGIWWSNGFVWANKVREPVIDVIGKDESQMTLLDTGHERVLILSGPPNNEMLNELSGMLGLFRRRVDLVLAMEVVLRSQLGHLREITTIGSIFALPDADIATSPRANATISAPVYLQLSNDVSLRCFPHVRAVADSISDWRVEIQRGDTVICLSRSLDNIAAVPTRRYDLAIAPVGQVALASRKSVASVFALNAREIGEANPDVQLVRIFDKDVVRISLTSEGGLRLPHWALVTG